MAAGGLKRTGRYALIAFAAFWVFCEEWIWNNFTALVARLANLPAIRRAESVIARQHPYLLLCLFALPALVMLPFKLYSLYLIGTGKAAQGIAVLVAAKAAGTALLTRLFVISRDKLLTIRLFARAYHWVQDKKQWLYGELEKLAWLQRARQAARRWRRGLRDKLARWRAARPGRLGQRLSLFREYLKKRQRPGAQETGSGQK